MMPESFILNQAVATLRIGGVIAYPTEAVYGLGCCPYQEEALQRILELKNRDLNKGLILIASNWEQLKPFVVELDKNLMQPIWNTWPGPVTWIFPAQPAVSNYLHGKFDSIAVRITDHPIVRALCDALAGPLVSTSANPAGMPPAKTVAEVQKYFHDELDFIVPGNVGNLKNPTEIRDAITQRIVRAG